MNKQLRNAERAHINTYIPSLFIIVMVASLVLDSFFPNPVYSASWSTEAGMIITLLGTALVYTAHVSSKKIRKDVKVSVNEVNFFVGPYAYVRHPGYAGMVLIGIGMSLVINSTVILVSSVLFYLIARSVATTEENHLLHEDSHVRTEYARYTKKVGRYF